MYNKVKQYAEGKGLTVETKAGVIYGQINGFFIAIQQNKETLACHTVNLWVKEGNTSSIPTIEDFLNQCKNKFSYLQSVTYNNGKITAKFLGTGLKWSKEYVPSLDAFLIEIIGYCQTYGLEPGCEACGSTENFNLYQINGDNHLLCQSCYESLLDRLQSSKEQKRKSGNGNIIGGIVGALLGSLLGVLLWVIVNQLGYISAIAGAVMVVCSMKGYELLGGRLNIIGIAISCILSLVMVFFAEQISLGIEIYQTFKDYEITYVEAFRSIPSFMQEPDVKSAVMSDLAIGYLLMAVGAFGTIRQALKNNSGTVNIKEVTTVR